MALGGQGEQGMSRGWGGVGAQHHLLVTARCWGQGQPRGRVRTKPKTRGKTRRLVGPLVLLSGPDTVPGPEGEGKAKDSDRTRVRRSWYGGQT